MNRTLKFALLGLASSLIVSCGSTKESRVPTGTSPTDVFERSDGTKEVLVEWWNRPGAIGKFAAVGTAKIVGSEGIAQRRAEVQARATIAASLEAEIQSLTELWSQEAGDLTDEASLSSMFNDESFTRQLVETTLRGARVDRYKTINGNVKCLVILEDPAVFVDNLVSKVDEDAIKSDAYFETEVKKGKAREALDSMISAGKKEAAASKAELQAAIGE